MTKTRQEQIAEKRAEMLDQMAPRAERRMNDKRLDGLRKPVVRRIISILLLALCLALAFTHDPAWLALINLIAVSTLWFILGRINRGFIDLPEELLDERIRARRNETYRLSYMIAVVVAAIIIPTCIIKNLSGGTMLGTHPVGSLFALVWLMLTLPAIVFTWREKEL